MCMPTGLRSRCHVHGLLPSPDVALKALCNAIIPAEHHICIAFRATPYQDEHTPSWKLLGQLKPQVLATPSAYACTSEVVPHCRVSIDWKYSSAAIPPGVMTDMPFQLDAPGIYKVIFIDKYLLSVRCNHHFVMLP